MRQKAKRLKHHPHFAASEIYQLALGQLHDVLAVHNDLA